MKHNMSEMESVSERERVADGKRKEKKKNGDKMGKE